jgi:phage-related protein
MPRTPRQKIDFDLTSVKNMLNAAHTRLEETRLGAQRDYKEIKRLTNKNNDDGVRLANTVNLEQARNNVQRTLTQTNQQFTDLVKLQSSITMDLLKLEASANGDAAEGNGVTMDAERRAQLRKLAADIAKGH